MDGKNFASEYAQVQITRFAGITNPDTRSGAPRSNAWQFHLEALSGKIQVQIYDLFPQTRDNKRLLNPPGYKMHIFPYMNKKKIF